MCVCVCGGGGKSAVGRPSHAVAKVYIWHAIISTPLFKTFLPLDRSKQTREAKLIFHCPHQLKGDVWTETPTNKLCRQIRLFHCKKAGRRRLHRFICYALLITGLPPTSNWVHRLPSEVDVSEACRPSVSGSHTYDRQLPGEPPFFPRTPSAEWWWQISCFRDESCLSKAVKAGWKGGQWAEDAP